jgi:predicted dehydrogenase
MSGPHNPIRVGMIGYGFVGKTFHAPLIQAVPGLKLAFVGSTQPDKVRADIPGATAIADRDSVATHPDVDLVVIASTNETHLPLAKAALVAGKDVVVDKPFTITLADARELAALAEKQGKLLAVFQNRRWDSSFLGAKKVLREGLLGEISHYESHYDRFRPNVRVRWREMPGPGGGLWYDLAPHLVDQALLLMGLPDAVLANFAMQREGAQTEDWAHVELIYPKARAILHTSVLVAGGVPNFIIHGVRGSWVKYGLDVQEKGLMAGEKPGGPGWGADPLRATYYDGAAGTQTEMAVPDGNQTLFYSGVRDAILGKGPNPVPPAQAVAVMAVIETAIQSAKEGRVLDFPLTKEERAAWAQTKI